MLIPKNCDINLKIKEFETIKVYLNEIKEQFQYFFQNILKNYNEIIEKVQNIISLLDNNNFNNLNETCDKLLKQISSFSEILKAAFFENDLFIKIKQTIEKLKFKEEKFEININNESEVQNLTSSLNLFEFEEKEYLKKYLNFSFMKRVNLMCNNYEDEKSNEFFCDKLCDKSLNISLEKNNEKVIDSNNGERINDIKRNEYKFIDYQFFNSIFSNLNIIEMNEIRKNKSLYNNLDLSLSSIKNVEDSFFLSEDDTPLFNMQAKNIFSNDFEINKTFIFIGASGAGKSSIIKYIISECYLLKKSIIISPKISKNSNKSTSSTLEHHFKKCDNILNRLKTYNTKYIYGHNKKDKNKIEKNRINFRFKYKNKISIKAKKYKK